ncbi:MAG: LemA family protein [Candidatus Bilamarchaeaceae archaeon]
MAFELFGLGLASTAVLCIGALLVVILAYVVMVYNRLITLRNRVKNAWAQIDVQLKRRYDLIPNLVETVKGYMKHERATLTEITKLRAQLISGNVEERAKANNVLSATLKSIFAVAENYPQLRASENFQKLQDEITGTEDKISYIRTAYNDAVYEFNTACDVFPSNIIASIFGFKHEPLFEAAATEKEAVKVKFD